MKKNLLPLLVTLLLSSCDTPKTTTAESTAVIDTISAEPASIKTGNDQTLCYALMSAQGDTIQLSLSRQGASVIGTLTYSIFEKDFNRGTLRGQMRGDTLLADYTFESEGVESVREVVFLTQGDDLIEGYGPVEERNGKEIFSPDSTLTFSADQLLKRTPCHQ